MRNSKYSKWILIVLMVLVSINSYLTAQKKSGFFIDEIWTFQNANEVKYVNYNVFDKIAKKVDQLCGASKDTTFTKSADYYNIGIYNQKDEYDKVNILKDKKGFNYYNVILNQTLNDSHPPLYHFVLHTVCSIYRCENLNFIGFSINLVFLLVSCIFIYLIVCKLFRLYWLALMCAGFYGFSNAFLGNVVFTRMYAMLSMFLTILLYLYVCLYEKKYDNKRLILLIGFVQFCALFCHYYSFLYVFPAFVVALYQVKDNPSIRRTWIKMNLVMMVVFLCIWPQVFIHIYKGSLLNMNVESIPFFYRINGAVSTLVHNLFSGSLILYVSFFCLLIVFLVTVIKTHKSTKWKKNIVDFLNNKWAIFLIPSVFYFYVVAIISPWVVERYEFPIFPNLSIIVIVIAWIAMDFVIKNRVAKYVTISVFSLLALPFWPWSNNHLFVLNEMTETKQSYIEKSENLCAVVLGNEHNWDYRDVVLNYSHPSYIVTNSVHARDFLSENLSSENYVLYANKYLSSDSIKATITNLNYDLVDYDYHTEFYNVYFMSKNTRP